MFVLGVNFVASRLTTFCKKGVQIWKVYHGVTQCLWLRFKSNRNPLTMCPGRIKTLSLFVSGYSFLESTTASNPYNDDNNTSICSLTYWVIPSFNICISHASKSFEIDDPVTRSVWASSTNTRPLDFPDCGLGSNLQDPKFKPEY